MRLPIGAAARMPARDDAVVHRAQHARALRPRKPGDHVVAIPAPDSRRQILVVRVARDRFRQRGRVTGGHQVAVHTVLHVLPHAADVGGDDRHAARHRFEHHVRRVVEFGRQHEEIRRIDTTRASRSCVDASGEDHLFGQRRGVRDATLERAHAADHHRRSSRPRFGRCAREQWTWRRRRAPRS